MYKNLIVAVAAAAALGLAAPVFAGSSASQSQTTQEHEHHHGWKHHDGHHHRHHRAWPFADALHEVDLSDTQKKTVRSYLKTSHETIREHMKGLHEERIAFLTAVPGTSAFDTAYKTYSSHAASAAQWRIQQIATLHTQIFNLLTGSQQAELKKELKEEAMEGDND
ncbi:MAG: Spy/CpxP family protein refolding chaperone [Sinobacteraceae bacterium]|nr:Spy/CpxP family protein refolding chaperone [Nevskiaceae bacterium]